MRTLGNVLWFLFGGFISAISMFIVGIVFCVTLIGIPFGIQMFKCARVMMWPFGKTVDIDFESHTYLNILWCGVGSSVVYIILGSILCLTLIGIPFGRQCFKLAKLFAAPFGATIDEN